MEGVATTAYSGLKSYWRRKGYRRLSHPTTTSDNNNLSGNGNDSKRRRFRIPKPRLKLGRFRIKFGLGSVRKFFLKIRNAYVNAMLGFASKGMIYGGGYGFGGGGGGDGGFGGKGHLKDYDEMMLIEIYKKMVLSKQQRHHGILVAAAAGGRRVSASEVASVQ